MATAVRGVKPAMGLAHRAMIGWRVALALVGGYALGALVAAVLAVGLPRLGVTRFEASTWGTLAGLLLMPFAPVAAFGFRKTWVASAWVIGPGLVLAVLLFAMRF